MKKRLTCIAAACILGIVLLAAAAGRQTTQFHTRYSAYSALPAVIHKNSAANRSGNSSAAINTDLQTVLLSEANDDSIIIPEETTEFPESEEKETAPSGQNDLDRTAPDAEATPSPATEDKHPEETVEPDQTEETKLPNEDAISEYEKKVTELVNQIRIENGLSPLAWNSELSAVARKKSQDMRDEHYFSHTSPVYGSPFDMMKTFGISYTTAGENIAMGQRTPEEVVEAWMNSPGHRANILNASFTQIGMGYAAEGNYWTQMFIG